MLHFRWAENLRLNGSSFLSETTKFQHVPFIVFLLGKRYEFLLQSAVLYFNTHNMVFLLFSGVCILGSFYLPVPFHSCNCLTACLFFGANSKIYVVCIIIRTTPFFGIVKYFMFSVYSNNPFLHLPASLKTVMKPVDMADWRPRVESNDRFVQF